MDGLIDRFEIGVGSSRRLHSCCSDWSGCYFLIPK